MIGNFEKGTESFEAAPKAKEGFSKGGMANMSALVDKKIAIIKESLASAK